MNPLLKTCHLLSIGANAILLALFAWLYVLTKDPACLPWMAYAAFMGALSTLALWKGKAGVVA